MFLSHRKTNVAKKVRNKQGGVQQTTEVVMPFWEVPLEMGPSPNTWNDANIAQADRITLRETVYHGAHDSSPNDDVSYYCDFICVLTSSINNLFKF